ncbi:uncharacterized protein PG998_013690 [Apiospora kogelbergensis]|uniref:uncharacterized protein n=1 Tax=Apiospora kogelbergensis TaxID=1337665 RepID=UPI00312F28FF
MPDCNGSPARHMWEQTIPQYAFTSEVVLNPMLSVAALHMKCHSAADSQLSLAITRYLDRSLVHHRQALKHIDSDIAEPIWLSAVILSNLYWLISHHTRPNETYELPLEAWDLLGGVSRLYAHRLDLLTRLGYGWFGYDIVPSTLSDEDLGPEPRASLQALDEDMSTLLNRFGVTTTDSGSQGGAQDAYVLFYYRAYFSGSKAKTIRRYIGTIALMFGPVYRKKLQGRDPLAMALYARMLVLMKVLDFAWWMNGNGEYEVMERDVYGMEQLIPTHLSWCMDWPRKVLSGEISLPPPLNGKYNIRLYRAILGVFTTRMRTQNTRSTENITLYPLPTPAEATRRSDAATTAPVINPLYNWPWCCEWNGRRGSFLGVPCWRRANQDHLSRTQHTLLNEIRPSPFGYSQGFAGRESCAREPPCRDGQASLDVAGLGTLEQFGRKFMVALGRGHRYSEY